MVFEDVTDEDKETESAFAKRERKKDDAHFLAGIRDIIAYICFLILYTVVIQTSGVEMAYPMASKMRDEVLGESFEEILVVDDVWNYLDTHFISTAFLEEGDDGLVEEMPSGRWGYILDVNRMIGAIQLQQKRVDVGGALPWNATPTCKVPQVFADEIDKCYPSIAEGGHATQPFGGSCGCDTSMFSPICATTPCDDSFFAEPNDDKYLWTLPINMTAASARLRLKDLRARRWIDLQTRELRLYFTVYNPAVDLFSAVELIFEPQQTGGVEVAANFKTFNMVRHMLMLTDASKMFPATNKDNGALVAEMLFYLIAIVLWLQTLGNWREHGFLRYFLNFWRVLDLLNYTMFMAVIGLRIFVLTLLNELNFNPPPNEFSNFHDPAWSIYQVSNIMALTAILMWLKLLRYLQLSARLSQLTQTIARAAIDMGNFMLIFLVVYTAYAQAFFMAFGMDVEAFSSYSNSFSQLFLIILGEFDFDAMKDANPDMAPLLFFSFVIFVFFILVNMFIAILGEAHKQIMSAQGTEPDEFVRKMRQGWKNHIGRIRERKGTASSGVQALAKNIEKMEDAVMPTVDECDEAAGDEAGLDDDMLRNGRGAGDPSPPGSPRVAGDVVNAFGVGVRRQVRAAKGRLGVMSLGEVMSAARDADGETLLQALNEQAENPPDPSGATAVGGGGGGGGRGGRILGLSHSLVDEMTKRVRDVEKDNDALRKWMETEHTATQEKISLLTEATFAITNMLAGVQGIDSMKLLEGSDVLAGNVLAGASRQVSSSIAAGVQGVAENVQGNVERRKRSVMVAGAKAGRDK